MDNNNSLPYGAISSLNSQNNVPNHRFYTPSQNTLGSNNLQDPIAIARNVHQRTTVPRDPLRVTYIQQERGRNSPSGNERHHLPFPNQGIDGVAGITGLSTSSASSHNSLINNQDINPLLNSNETNIGTRTGNLSGVNRYFHAPWSINGITHAERPSTNSYRPLDPVTGRPITQLPTLAEQNSIQAGSCPSHTALSKGFGNQSSKKHSGIKRRVSREDSEDGIPRPASKLLLTEENMAAKMHNLSISNDHCYHINGLPTQLGKMESSSLSPAMSGSSVNDEDDEAKEDDNNNMESVSSSGFMLAPGIKEMLANSNHILPKTILDQMNKPCLAVIPWKPPDDLVKNITFNFSNKTDDEKMVEKDCKENNNSKGNQIFTFGNCSVDHTEVIEDYGTFDLDDDDMDL